MSRLTVAQAAGLIPPIAATPQILWAFNSRATAIKNGVDHLMTLPALGSVLGAGGVAATWSAAYPVLTTSGAVTADTSNTWQPADNHFFVTNAPVWEALYDASPNANFRIEVDGVWSHSTLQVPNSSGFNGALRRLIFMHGTQYATSAAALAAAVSISLPTAPGVNSFVVLEPGTANQETVRVTGAPTGTGPYAVPVTALANAHAAGVVAVVCTRKQRRIRIHGAFPLKAITTSPTDTIAPGFTGHTTTAAWLGDSWLQGGSDNAAELCGRVMGWDINLRDAIGGSGYVAGGPPGSPFTAASRIDRLLTAKPDVLVLAGGNNDAASDYATVRAAADAVMAKCTAVPKVYVVGPWWPTDPYIVTHAQVAAALSDAAAARGFTYIDTAADHVFYGTGKTTAQVGDGNADYYIGSDGSHPTDTDAIPAGELLSGRQYLGLWLATKLLATGLPAA